AAGILRVGLCGRTLVLCASLIDARRMVAPRRIGIQIRGTLCAQPGNHLLANEFGFKKTMVEIFIHKNAAKQRIYGSPRFWRVAQHAKFEREVIAMPLNISIYTSRISFKMRTIAL